MLSFEKVAQASKRDSCKLDLSEILFSKLKIQSWHSIHWALFFFDWLTDSKNKNVVCVWRLIADQYCQRDCSFVLRTNMSPRSGVVWRFVSVSSINLLCDFFWLTHFIAKTSTKAFNRLNSVHKNRDEDIFIWLVQYESSVDISSPFGKAIIHLLRTVNFNSSACISQLNSKMLQPVVNGLLVATTTESYVCLWDS